MMKTLVKPFNLLLAGYSFVRSTLTKRPYSYGLPPAIGIELTNHCNLQCPECTAGSGLMKRDRGFMEIGLFERILSELGPYLYNINLYFQGEPLMHPAFPLFIGKSRGIRSTISTNGHYLTPENCAAIVKSGLGKLIISIDGTDQSAYSAYRMNGNIDKVLQGIRNFMDARKRNASSVRTEIQFLVNRMNEHQLPRIKKIAAALNASLRLKSMQIISGDSFEHWLPERSEFRRYEKRDGVYTIKNHLPGRCVRLWFNPVVTWDGKVVPCCFDKDAEHIMGDLNQESFRDIWNSSKYRLFRKVLLTDRAATDICRNCTSGIMGVRV